MFDKKHGRDNNLVVILTLISLMVDQVKVVLFKTLIKRMRTSESEHTGTQNIITRKHLCIKTGDDNMCNHKECREGYIVTLYKHLE